MRRQEGAIRAAQLRFLLIRQDCALSVGRAQIESARFLLEFQTRAAQFIHIPSLFLSLLTLVFRALLNSARFGARLAPPAAASAFPRAPLNRQVVLRSNER